MSKTTDVIIIGAGVIGTAIAFEMAKKGYNTLNIDANAEAGHGSTSGSCAVIRVYYSTLEGTALAYESYHYWRDWAQYLEVEDERGMAEFLEMGCLCLKTEANGYMEKQTAISEELGITCNHWDVEQIKERLPHYEFDCFYPAKLPDDEGFSQPTNGRIKGGVFYPQSGYVTDPALSSHNLQIAAQAKGAEFLYQTRVTEILQRNGRTHGIKLTSGEEILAPIIINVAGPASSIINEMAGVTEDMSITTRALKQEVVHVPMPEGYFGDGGRIVVSDSDICAYCRPEKSDHLLIGSEDPPCDAHIYVDDPDSDEWRDFSEQSRTQAMRMAQRAPTLGIPNSPKGVVDLYDVTPDWIPIYDKSSLPGFYMACGTSGNQYKNAPMVGKMMAELVNYCEAGADHDIEPLVVKMPYTGLDLNVGFFSRKREINQDSSFSVLG